MRASIFPIDLLTKSKANTTDSKGDLGNLCNKLIKTYEGSESCTDHPIHSTKEHNWASVASKVLRVYDQIADNNNWI